MKKRITIVPVVFLMIALFISCRGGGLEGTYLPKNEAANNLYFSKLVFKGNRVTCYLSIMGMALPASYEYRYSMNGNIVSFEADAPEVSGSVEFTYDKDKQELSLLEGTFGGDGAVWGKEGTFDPDILVRKPQEQEETSTQEQPTKNRQQPITNKEDSKTPEKKTQTPVSTLDPVATPTPTPPQPKEDKIAPPIPTSVQLNELLNKITNADDNATDELRSILSNSLRVEGASNISNVQQLITDVSNGTHYKVTNVNTDANGKVISITVSK